MNQSRFALLLAVLTLAAGTASCSSFGVRRQKVAPQRPRFGRTTQTTAFGTFEIETGFAADPSDSFDLPIRIKTGVSPTAELFAEISPFQTFDVPGEDPKGPSDLQIGYRQRLMDESKSYPATAFEFSTALPVGEDDLPGSSGYTSFFAGLSADRTFDQILATASYRFGLIGTAQPSDLNVQHFASVAGLFPVADRWWVLGEMAGVYDVESSVQPLVGNLAGVFEFTDTLVFDAGIVFGLNDDAPDLVLQFGLTTNLGILF